MSKINRGSTFDIILIGGSAGSMPVFFQLLNALPEDFPIPIVLIIHRARNINSEMDKLLSSGGRQKKIIEPEDKTPITNGGVYLAPQNYHLLIEEEESFGLDYSDEIHFSRPSIDVSFQSAARVYRNKTLAVVLSGANKDGANGLEAVLEEGGTGIVQMPSTAQYPAMPNAAKQQNPNVLILDPEALVTYIRQLNS